MSQENLTAFDPLFVGATRPTLAWGVSLEALVICVGVSAFFFIWTAKPIFLLAYAPMHGACYLMMLKDPRFFRLFLLFGLTKRQSKRRKLIGASTATPMTNIRRFKGKEL